MFRLLVLSLLCTAALSAQALRGFTTEGAKAQRELEEKLLAVPQPDRIREIIRTMSEEPHHTGSEAGNRVAEYVLNEFRSYGLDAEYHEFVGLMPTPLERSLELVSPISYKARLSEPAIAEDKDSSDSGGLPTYNAYSPDGDVRAQIVYVNYGMPADYEKLAQLGVDVRGKIVLARYMGGWRGIKPKVAAEHGAIGCIIYSDPADDGFFKGDAYPVGRYRPKWGVQRGSIMDMPIHPGDPLTPGRGAVPGERRPAISESKTLPTIPTLPISWGDALPILENLGGPVAPREWRGSLPLTYHVGAGPAEVRLKLAFDWKNPTGRNIIAKIPGAVYPDEWVIYGNHHDAWVNGATDPVSGHAPLLETARAIGEAIKQGWKPKRTIIFASWDAEEWGLIGSTEWGEQFADELREKTVVYFNTDSNFAGTLSLQGSHTLERFLNQVVVDLDDPRSGRSLYTEIRSKALEDAADDEKRKIDARKDVRVAAVGSGSDYTVFLDHLAIASINSAFRGEGTGVYHSNYDSFDWYRRFGDPGFVYGRAMAQFHAAAMTRVANAEIAPFEFVALAETIGTYLDELEKLAGEQVDVKQLRPAWQRLTKAAADYEKTLTSVFSSGGPKGDPTAVNAILRSVERVMARKEGLPGREWFKHQLYAPGFYTGYGVKTIPGVREALEQKDLETAKRQVKVFEEVLLAVAKRVGEAEAELKKLRP